MAWNEPGGKNNDPWGGGNRNDDGPPDLDEVIKNLSDKVSGFFGGGGDTGDIKGPLVIILVLLLLLYGYLCFYRVDTSERGVVLRFGKFYEETDPGPNWAWWPVDSVQKVNVTQVRDAGGSQTWEMLTKDLNIIRLTLNVQYQVRDPRFFLLEIAEPELVLAHATESALRHVTGTRTMDDVLTFGRESMRLEVQERLQTYLDRYETGLQVVEVNLKEAQAPDDVKEAFEDVNRAKEDEVRAKNQAEAYANQVIPEARGQAQRQLEEAAAYKEEVIARATGEAQRFENLYAEYRKAPEVTRNRLYLETLEKIYGNSTKVLVDVENGNNLLYLPFDKLIQQEQPAPRSQVELPGQLVDDVNKQGQRAKDRLRDWQDKRREER